MHQLTELLGRVQAGDTGARDALFATAYGELHRLARARLRHGGRDTILDTTCLVHESYLRFVRVGELRAEDRRAFFAYASQVMRSVIVNSIRERIARKRGGAESPIPLSTNAGLEVADDDERVLAVHEALESLEKADPNWLDPHIELAAIYYKLHRPDDGQRERDIVQQLEAKQQKLGPPQ